MDLKNPTMIEGRLKNSSIKHTKAVVSVATALSMNCRHLVAEAP